MPSLFPVPPSLRSGNGICMELLPVAVPVRPAVGLKPFHLLYVLWPLKSYRFWQKIFSLFILTNNVRFLWPFFLIFLHFACMPLICRFWRLLLAGMVLYYHLSENRFWGVLEGCFFLALPLNLWFFPLFFFFSPVRCFYCVPHYSPIALLLLFALSTYCRSIAYWCFVVILVIAF